MTTKIPYTLLADGTAGQLLTWSAAGLPATVATGTATHVLTSNGAGAAPTFQAASGSSGNGGATTTTSGTSLTLTSSSNRVQNFAPTAGGLYCKLPDATTLSTAGGPVFIIKNTGSYAFPVIDGGTPGQAIAFLEPGSGCMVYCSSIATAKGKWYAGSGDVGYMSEILNGVMDNKLSVEASAQNTQYSVARISDTKFLWVFYNSTSNILKCAVISITDADTLSSGSVASIVTLSTLAAFTACSMDASNVAVAYAGTLVNSIIVVGISGTTATPGTATSVVAATSGNLHLYNISSTSVFYAYVSAATSKGVVISSMSTSGNTVNAITTCRTSQLAEGNLSVGKGDVNTYFYATCGTSNFLDTQLVTVSGTAVTANTALANQSNSTTVAANIQTFALSSSFFLTVYQNISPLNVHWITHRAVTSTTLEASAGGNGASGIPANGFIRVNTAVYARIGAVRLDNAIVFIFSGTYGGTYAAPLLLFFKTGQNNKNISFSHGSFLPIEPSTVSFATNPCTAETLKTSPGKIIGCAKAETGSNQLYPYIIHGIENP